MTNVFVAMMFLDALLLWAVIRTRGWWLPKGVAIVVVLAFNFLLLQAPDSFTGYAINGGVPDGSRLVACDVVEPNAIYFWVVPLGKPTTFGYRYLTEEPRAYRFDYSRELHGECEAAKKAMARGTVVGVVGLQHPRQGEPRQQSGGKHLYRMPPALPPKGTP